MPKCTTRCSRGNPTAEGDFFPHIHRAKNRWWEWSAIRRLFRSPGTDAATCDERKLEIVLEQVIGTIFSLMMSRLRIIDELELNYMRGSILAGSANDGRFKLY